MIPRTIKCAECVGRFATLDVAVNGIQAGTRVKIVKFSKTLTAETAKCPVCGQMSKIEGLKKDSLTLCDEQTATNAQEHEKTVMNAANLIAELKEKLKEAQVNVRIWKYECATAQKERDSALIEAHRWRNKYARAFSNDLLRAAGS